MTTKTYSTLLAVALVGLLGSLPAGAQQGVTFELLGGQYSPDGDVDADVVYGLRGGYRLSENLGFDVTASLFQQSESVLGIGDIGLDMLLTDVSVKWYPRPGKRAELFLYGGPGWAFLDVETAFAGASADSLTAHAGVGVDLLITDRFYLRPDVRGRWFEKGSGIDLEGTLGLGFRIGKSWKRGSF